MENATLISFAGFLDENMPPELKSNNPDAGTDWIYAGQDSDLEFSWDLPTDLGGDEEDQPATVYMMKAKLTPSGVNCFFYMPNQRRPRQSIHVPMRLPESPEEFQDSLVTFLETMDGVIEIFESTAFKTKLSSKFKQVPLSSVFGMFNKKKEEPEAEPEAPAAPSLDAAIQSKDENAVLAAARGKFRVKGDQIIDIYNLAKELRSNKLMNLVKTLKAESQQVDAFVSSLLEEECPLKKPEVG